jgi:hypothetical protein
MSFCSASAKENAIGSATAESASAESQYEAAVKRSRKSLGQVDLVINESALPEETIKGLIDECIVPAMVDRFLKENMPSAGAEKTRNRNAGTPHARHGARRGSRKKTK